MNLKSEDYDLWMENFRQALIEVGIDELTTYKMIESINKRFRKDVLNI